MTRLIVLVLACALAALALSSADTEANPSWVPIEIVATRKSNPGPGTRVYPDVQAYYDPDTRALVVNADPSLDVEVRILLDGAQVFFSSSVSTTFILPLSNGSYTIEIEGDDWIGSGSIPTA